MSHLYINVIFFQDRLGTNIGKLKNDYRCLRCCVKPGGEWHYQPMMKQGAIILGTGGDNSNRCARKNGAGKNSAKKRHEKTKNARLLLLASCPYLKPRQTLDRNRTIDRAVRGGAVCRFLHVQGGGKLLRGLHRHWRDVQRDGRRDPGEYRGRRVQNAAGRAEDSQEQLTEGGREGGGGGG